MTFERPTVKERKMIRETIYGDGALFTLAENPDGTWFVSVADSIIEADSPAELLRELATVLEEC